MLGDPQNLSADGVHATEVKLQGGRYASLEAPVKALNLHGVGRLRKFTDTIS